MKKCEDIEKDLPFYLDGSLTGVEKQVVEEHLNTCPHCSKALVELSKTGSLLGNLADVEPPPWFKQKIMAGVRREAEKKSLVQKLFYPLSIKIPVQIMAAIFIAVLAVHIYRVGEDRMKEVMPSSAPAPVMEIPQKPLTAQEIKTSAAEEKQKQEAVQAMGALRSDAPDKKTDAAKDMSSQAAPAPAARSVAVPSAELKYKEEKDFSGAPMRINESKALQMQSEIPQTAVYLRVSDVHAAFTAAEKILIKYDAKNVSGKVNQGKIVLTAEIKTRRMKDLIPQLKTIGRVEENRVIPDRVEENMTLVIEISNK